MLLKCRPLPCAFYDHVRSSPASEVRVSRAEGSQTLQLTRSGKGMGDKRGEPKIAADVVNCCLGGAAASMLPWNSWALLEQSKAELEQTLTWVALPAGL